MGCFAGNLGAFSVFDAEIFCFIMAMEHALQLGWGNIWLESNSTSALFAFQNASGADPFEKPMAQLLSDMFSGDFFAYITGGEQLCGWSC